MSPGHELKRSWVVLLVCSLGASVGAAAFPLFFVPVIGVRLEAQFGWSRLDTSSLTSVAFVGGAMGTVIVGWLNDKWSTKLPVVASMAAIGGMLLLAAMAPPSIMAWQIGIFVFMLLGAGTLSAPFIKIICEHFQAMRGLALGITIGSVSFASAVALPAISRLIDRAGTAQFFIGAGIVYVVVVAPLLLVLLPESGRGRANTPLAPGKRETRPRPHALWLLGIAGVLLSIITGSAAHLAAVAADGHAIAPAVIGSIFAAGVMISRPLAGFIIDHVNAAHVGAAAAAMAAIGLLIAALFGDRYLIVSALLLAVAVGAEFDIVAYLASHYAASSQFGRLFGWMYSGMLVAAAAGPLFIAFQLELFGTYRIPFSSAAALAGIAACIMLILPPYARERSKQ
jgi:MFS family permease